MNLDGGGMSKITFLATTSDCKQEEIPEHKVDIFQPFLSDAL